MSRWLVQAFYNESNTIEIDKPSSSDERANKKLQYIFDILENIQASDKYYTYEKIELDDKYILTIKRECTPKSGEETMPMVKNILNRYKINYREI